MQTDNVTGMVILCFKRFYFQRGRQGGEGNINVRLPLMHTPQWTQPATQARALTGNGTSDPLICRLALSPLSHTPRRAHINAFNYNTLPHPLMRVL